MAMAMVRVILSFSRSPITFMSSPTSGYFFLNSGEFNINSVSMTIFSVSEKGAYPTPKEVSFEDGTASFLPKTCTKSPDP